MRILKTPTTGPTFQIGQIGLFLVSTATPLAVAFENLTILETDDE
jgi:hypothetical protein